MLFRSGAAGGIDARGVRLPRLTATKRYGITQDARPSGGVGALEVSGPFVIAARPRGSEPEAIGVAFVGGRTVGTSLPDDEVAVGGARCHDIRIGILGDGTIDGDQILNTAPRRDGLALAIALDRGRVGAVEVIVREVVAR